ncbi:PIG-L family deacetylase [Jiangella alba]|uniref:N-acetylglucosaminyl deacetylase, LmbE family n=1 Tax=Jiangella alba TaxID=561176 RepID=A0A1H5P7X4_9ACTN|nr:PIG-L family deacetylase [Jiangella alba]SEF09121.1 N-acetylglucosaminyl deacetylase, LmbE family [Jiangella alba]
MFSNPSPLRGRTVLVLHAHPDDEAIFTGVTMRRLADAGARVVLVTATLGELGEVHVPLSPGETMAQRRVAELESAAALLGVQRLVLLGARDSGLPGAADNVHPDALAAADPSRVARRMADLIDEESAEALVHDDGRGIYGHPDHLAAHRIGAAAARLTGVTAYQSTVDRDHLHDRVTRSHLIHAAAEATGLPFGVPSADVALRIGATAGELAVKRAAIAVHASQVSAESLGHAGFDEAYGYEWYLRSGASSGILDELALPAVVGAPA